MVHEDVVKEIFDTSKNAAQKTVTLCINISKETAKELMNSVKDFMVAMNKIKSNSIKGNQIKLKELIKKGQAEELELNEGEFKELKKMLNKEGVRFSIVRNKENETYSVFYQAKDVNVIDRAFKNTLNKIQNMEEKKSVKQKMKNLQKSIHHKKQLIKELEKNQKKQRTR